MRCDLCDNYEAAVSVTFPSSSWVLCLTCWDKKVLLIRRAGKPVPNARRLYVEPSHPARA